MLWECFLPAWRDDPLRQELWAVYEDAEAEARAVSQADKWKRWCRPDGVAETDLGGSAVVVYHDDGTATVKVTREKGSMFHELFHCGSYCAPARNHTHENEWGTWEEAFCNAFRYFMELRYFKGTEWSEEVDARMAREKAGTPNADPILRACGKDYQQFRQLWGDLNRSGQDVDTFIQKRGT
jgi:hypothetical protein